MWVEGKSNDYCKKNVLSLHGLHGLHSLHSLHGLRFGVTVQVDGLITVNEKQRWKNAIRLPPPRKRQNHFINHLGVQRGFLASPYLIYRGFWLSSIKRFNWLMNLPIVRLIVQLGSCQALSR